MPRTEDENMIQAIARGVFRSDVPHMGSARAIAVISVGL